MLMLRRLLDESSSSAAGCSAKRMQSHGRRLGHAGEPLRWSHGQHQGLGMTALVTLGTDALARARA